MKTVKVRNVIIGEGIPKICVPAAGKTREEIFREVAAAAEQKADVIELRADGYENVPDHESLTEILAGVREIIGDIPLLLTVRTSAEGGETDISGNDYADVIISAVRTGLVDMVDTEIFRGSEISSRIIREAHNAGVKVIASYHDFSMTPDKDDIIERMQRMQDTGADIIKIAVMPQSSRDVVTLLDAAETVCERAECPVIAISMSELGMISRLACEALGTAMTFGAASKATAPGQPGIDELKQALSVFHRSLIR